MSSTRPHIDKLAALPARGHPLELFALFRRWPSTPLRDLAYTAIWNTLIAVALALLQHLSGRWDTPFMRMFGYTLLASQLVGFLIHGALVAFERLVPRSANRLLARLLELALMVLCGMLGIALASAILRRVNPVQLLLGAEMWLLLAFGFATAGFTIAVLVLGERRIARETLAARQQEQVETAARLVAEARLRALQAQIEPHFLYNTLANVLSLIDTQPARARRMLERFIDYLRASLAASRADAATLGAELDLAGAYLDVLEVRMGARLRWRIEADAACRVLPIAPMLIQPLVENAIMHGIEPKVDGGEVVVRVFCADGLLRIEVCDDGRGLAPAAPRSGGGVGLANLRERVRQRYGQRARLELIENPAGGVTARLLLPLEVPPSTPSAP